MKTIFIAGLAALLLSSISATAQSISDADLDKAMVTCGSHKSLVVSARIPRWEVGWEHCQAIENEVASRKDAKEKGAQFSKDLADKLLKSK